MFIDASALVAILLREDDADDLVARLSRAHVRLTSPLAVWETAVALARGLEVPIVEASAIIEAYLREMEIEAIAVEPETRLTALEAYDRFGKGRHPAQLNFGDCFAYACAKHANVPLLFKGRDFGLTDISTA